MNKINPLDSPEERADIAWYLAQVETAEELAELKTVDAFTKSRLNQACQLLARNQQALIRRLAMSSEYRRRLAA